MNTTKAQDFKAYVLYLITTFLLSVSCDGTELHYKNYPKAEITLKSGEKILVYIAESASEQRLGLSHIKDEEFKDNEAMLFPADKMKKRQFWMPETHMDLDVFFMTENYYILDIHRSLKHFPKRNPESKIPKSKEVYSQHILEMKSSSPLAKKIKYGMILNFKKLEQHP